MEETSRRDEQISQALVPQEFRFIRTEKREIGKDALQVVDKICKEGGLSHDCQRKIAAAAAYGMDSTNLKRYFLGDGAVKESCDIDFLVTVFLMTDNRFLREKIPLDGKYNQQAFRKLMGDGHEKRSDSKDELIGVLQLQAEEYRKREAWMEEQLDLYQRKVVLGGEDTLSGKQTEPGDIPADRETSDAAPQPSENKEETDAVMQQETYAENEEKNDNKEAILHMIRFISSGKNEIESAVSAQSSQAVRIAEETVSGGNGAGPRKSVKQARLENKRLRWFTNMIVSGKYDKQRIDMVADAIDRGIKLEKITSKIRPDIPPDNLKTLLEYTIKYAN